MLKEMELNPYNFGTCDWFCFKVIKEMPLDKTIKISSVKSLIFKYYVDKTICNSLNKLSNDGYLKCEGRNHNSETIYVKHKQIKGE